MALFGTLNDHLVRVHCNLYCFCSLLSLIRSLHGLDLLAKTLVSLLMHVLDTHHHTSLRALLICTIIVAFGTVPRHSGAKAKIPRHCAEHESINVQQCPVSPLNA